MALFDIDLPSATIFDFANMNPFELGRNVFLSLILVFVILFAVLEKFNMFSKKVNIIVALGISILLATTPAFTIFSAYVIEVGGSGMLMIFGILLIGGTLMWALGRGRDIYDEQVSPTRKERKVLDKLEKLDKKLARARGNKRQSLLRQRERLEDELRVARAERKYR